MWFQQKALLLHYKIKVYKFIENTSRLVVLYLYCSLLESVGREAIRLFSFYGFFSCNLSSILNPQFILNRCIIMLKAHQYYIIKIIYILMGFYL